MRIEPILALVLAFACQSPAQPVLSERLPSSVSAQTTAGRALPRIVATNPPPKQSPSIPVASIPPMASSVPVSPPCPSDMTHVKTACIDRFEAHLVAVKPDGTEVRHSPYERPEPGIVYAARSQEGVVPQAYISGDESKAACEQAGKRLCTLAEWYDTCRGPDRTTFPYGAEYKKTECNVSNGHLLSKLYGTDPRVWKYDEHFNNPKLNQTQGFLAPTGQYKTCTNDYGAFDMVGNLHEWIADRVDSSLEQKIPLRDDIRKKLRRNAGHGIFMGGFFSTTHEHGRGCGFVTIGHETRYHDYSTGFRCCKDARLSSP